MKFSKQNIFVQLKIVYTLLTSDTIKWLTSPPEIAENPKLQTVPHEKLFEKLTRRYVLTATVDGGHRHLLYVIGVTTNVCCLVDTGTEVSALRAGSNDCPYEPIFNW